MSLGSNWWALLASYVYVGAMFVVGQVLRSFAGQPVEITRKVVHVGVGMWAVPTVLLFDDWRFALVPPLTFVAANALSYRLNLVKVIETGKRGHLGTVYFPISFAALLYAFWAQPAVFVAAIMPMTWGDAMAAAVGERYGERKYEVLGHQRSWEGSTAMFVFSFVAVFLALMLLGDLSPASGLIYALVTALGAAAVEGVSPWGLDNLTVPLISAGILALLAG